MYELWQSEACALSTQAANVAARSFISRRSAILESERGTGLRRDGGGRPDSGVSR
jgi:hypothetical protein